MWKRIECVIYHRLVLILIFVLSLLNDGNVTNEAGVFLFVLFKFLILKQFKALVTSINVCTISFIRS